MSTGSTERIVGLNEFFAASEARVDRWRTLNRVAKAVSLGLPLLTPEGDEQRCHPHDQDYPIVRHQTTFPTWRSRW